MSPVEPVSSWFRHLALMGRSAKTMRKYAYVALRLSEFLAQAGADVVSATETDLLEYRALRTREQPEPIAKTTWDAEATAINRLYAWLVAEGYVSARPWRSDGGRDSLRNGVTRDLRVRHMTLEQYRYFRDVGLAGAVGSVRGTGRNHAASVHMGQDPVAGVGADAAARHAFLADWLRQDQSRLEPSLLRFVGTTGYDIDTLHADLARFGFLLGDTGTQLFGRDQP